MDNVIKLLSPIESRDEYGVTRKTYVSREVMCKVDSVTRAEFFDGGRSGLNPQFRMTMFHGDYEGESLVEFEGKTYAVYRTYRTDFDYIELYVERRGGTNGKDSTDGSPCG